MRGSASGPGRLDERRSARRALGGGDEPETETAVPVRREGEPRPVRRPRGLDVVGWVRSEPPLHGCRRRSMTKRSCDPGFPLAQARRRPSGDHAGSMSSEARSRSAAARFRSSPRRRRSRCCRSARSRTRAAARRARASPRCLPGGATGARRGAAVGPRRARGARARGDDRRTVDPSAASVPAGATAIQVPAIERAASMAKPTDDDRCSHGGTSTTGPGRPPRLQWRPRRGSRVAKGGGL